MRSEALNLYEAMKSTGDIMWKDEKLIILITYSNNYNTIYNKP